MQPQFGATSTADEVLEGVSLEGKTVLVTGASAGIGVETIRVLVEHGARVIGAARDLSKARTATAAIAKNSAASSASLELIALDLANLSSVRQAAAALLSRADAIDLVIANAGVMATPFGLTEDGFETQFGTNHLGHFLFINSIASLIRSGGRVVSLSSAGHRFADVDLVDVNFESTAYEPMIAYGRSKTANILFAVAFDQRHHGRGVRATAVHPGSIQTELIRYMEPARLEALRAQINQQRASQGLAPFQYKTIGQGAATTVWAGVVAEQHQVGGQYCENCHVGQLVAEDVAISATTEGVRSYALDPVRAEALWQLSERLVGEAF